MQKKQGKLTIFVSIVWIFLFSIPAYATDNIELGGSIILAMLPVTAGGMAFSKDDKEGGAQFSKSFATALGITYALKYSINEERPNGDPYSFPSGHSSAAFSTASFLQMRYGWEYGIPAYIAASFVGWSRIESNNHYLHDVLAGAAIGIISSYFFTDAYQQEGIVISPFAGEGAYGLVLSKTF